MEKIPTDRDDKPRQRISIAKCGQLIKKSESVKKAIAKEQSTDSGNKAAKPTTTGKKDGALKSKPSAPAEQTPQVDDSDSDEEAKEKMKDKETLRAIILKEKLKKIEEDKLKPKPNPGTISKNKKKKLILLKKHLMRK